jgi:DNA-binding NarL/FixJ family response regulator
MPRILLVGGEDIVRSGLAALLGAAVDLAVVSETSRFDEKRLTALQVDAVVLVATQMDDGELDQIRRMCEAIARVVLVVGRIQPAQLEQAVRLGVTGLMTLETEVSTLIAGVRSVIRGEVTIDPRLLSDLLTTMVTSELECVPAGNLPADSTRDIRYESLSSRESEILSLIACGARNSQVAEALKISPHTVRAHLRNILDKLRLENRMQAAMWAQRRGIGSPASIPVKAVTKIRHAVQASTGSSATTKPVSVLVES